MTKDELRAWAERVSTESFWQIPPEGRAQAIAVIALLDENKRMQPVYEMAKEYVRHRNDGYDVLASAAGDELVKLFATKGGE
jgi:hypothetical protein